MVGPSTELYAQVLRKHKGEASSVGPAKVIGVCFDQEE